MLTGGTVNRDLITDFAVEVLEERINANGKVELNEEEEDAKLRDLESKEHSNDPKNQWQDQEKYIEYHVRYKKAFRAL